MTVPQFRRRPMLQEDEDFCRRGDARRLADRIERQWAALGHEVQCALHPVHDERGNIVTYEIKSNLRNGYPVAA